MEILPFLYLGSAYHAARRDMLDALGITALLNVSSDCPNHFEGHYQYKCIPVEDNHKADIGSWFMEAIEYIGRWAQTGSQTGSQNPVGEHERKPLGTWVLWAGLSRLGIRVCSFPLLPTGRPVHWVLCGAGMKRSIPLPIVGIFLHGFRCIGG